MRLIDADALLERFDNTKYDVIELYGDDGYTHATVERLFNQAPTVETKKEELTSLEKELILKALGQYRYVASDFVGYEECQWMSATIDEISKILNLEG